ncbi:hypothetical protein CEXT_119701 [Caerostris extrusa]|uniref:Uncharacterized protein n=1 Tax=Caerostris extrusa TaxID=172846 RepID=A0AAV4NG62_CAEEX|nr:hypothetical protein CEXT_119701 [Caerostris extrusa]
MPGLMQESYEKRNKQPTVTKIKRIKKRRNFKNARIFSAKGYLTQSIRVEMYSIFPLDISMDGIIKNETVCEWLELPGKYGSQQNKSHST